MNDNIKRQEFKDFVGCVFDDVVEQAFEDDDYDLADWENEENAHYYVQMVLGEVGVMEASICDSGNRVLSHARAAIKGLLHLYCMQVAGKLD